MKDNLKDILSNLNPEVDQETLLQYLQGHLPDEKRKELEAQMQESDFESDALEGLKSFENKGQLMLMVEQLNRDLKKKAAKRQRFREGLKIKSDPWIWVAVLLILLLVVISYIVIHYQLGH